MGDGKGQRGEVGEQSSEVGGEQTRSALTPQGKFPAWFDFSPDGLIEWEG